METKMSRTAPIALAGTLAAVLVGLALHAPAAVAEAPQCKNKANKYVACTDKLRANTPRRAGAKGGNVEFEWKVEEGESSKRRRGLKSGQ
jgi:hypothetical protein